MINVYEVSRIYIMLIFQAKISWNFYNTTNTVVDCIWENGHLGTLIGYAARYNGILIRTAWSKINWVFFIFSKFLQTFSIFWWQQEWNDNCSPVEVMSSLHRYFVAWQLR